jgi:hypothetical protein
VSRIQLCITQSRGEGFLGCEGDPWKLYKLDCDLIWKVDLNLKLITVHLRTESHAFLYSLSDRPMDTVVNKKKMLC